MAEVCDIYKCTVKFFDDGNKCVSIELVAACSMGDAYDRLEEFYGDDLASVEIELTCEDEGIYHLGFLEDTLVIEEMFKDPCHLPCFTHAI